MKLALTSGFVPPFARLVHGGPPCDFGRIGDRDLQMLDRSLGDGGRVVYPTDSDYDAVRVIWNDAFEAHPTFVVRPRGDADVVAAVRWCRARGITPRLRAGGHSFAGYSTGNTVVIDLRDMDAVASESDGTVTIGAGGRLGAIYRDLYCRKRLTLPAGTCPTVGISGLTMSGGLGYLMRSHGLTIDRLRSATIVLADGSVLTVDEGRDADLFWALRGGGMGSYGVVTAWNFEPVVHQPQSLVVVRWHPEDFVEMMAAFQPWLASLPPVGFAGAALIANAAGAVTAQVTMVDQGDGSNLLDLANALVADCDATPSSGPNRTDVALPDQNGCKVTDPFELDAGYRKSRYAMAPVPRATLEVLRDRFVGRAANSELDGTSAFLLMDGCGGRIDDVSPDVTAYAHRGALFSGQFGATWNHVPSDQQSAAGAASESWLDDLYAAVLPGFDGGCYPGYWDRKIVDWPTLYYGAGFDRLVDVKNRYDPDDFFRFPRSIPTSVEA